MEQNGEFSKDGRDTKVASTKIKIGSEIDIAGLVKAAIEYIKKELIQKQDRKSVMEPQVQPKIEEPQM